MNRVCPHDTTRFRKSELLTGRTENWEAYHGADDEQGAEEVQHVDECQARVHCRQRLAHKTWPGFIIIISICSSTIYIDKYFNEKES
jgi:hypothetical protein